MPEVEKDLPNPTATPPGAPEQADDLLSQLAGEEVDRLLAEAEVERPTGAGPDASALPADTAAVDQEAEQALKAMLDEASKELEAASAEPAPAPEPSASTESTAPAAPAAAAQDDLSAQLDGLFQVLNEPGKPVPEPAVLPPAPAATAVAPATEAQPLSDEELQEGAHPPKELLEPLEPLEAPDASAEPTEPAVPVWARPLQWINAPFSFLPEPARAAIGWIGLLTLINAGLILGYVVFIRGKR